MSLIIISVGLLSQGAPRRESTNGPDAVPISRLLRYCHYWTKIWVESLWWHARHATACGRKSEVGLFSSGLVLALQIPPPGRGWHPFARRGFLRRWGTRICNDRQGATTADRLGWRKKNKPGPGQENLASIFLFGAEGSTSVKTQDVENSVLVAAAKPKGHNWPSVAVSLLAKWQQFFTWWGDSP